MLVLHSIDANAGETWVGSAVPEVAAGHGQTVRHSHTNQCAPIDPLSSSWAHPLLVLPASASHMPSREEEHREKEVRVLR